MYIHVYMQYYTIPTCIQVCNIIHSHDKNLYCTYLGYAPVGGMCSLNYSCGVVEHYGLQCGFTVAHETGHA